MAKNESYYSGEKYNSLAKKHGYRSRAAFKLIQIDKEENILKKNLNIIDLGCAPGGWSQVVSEKLKGTGSIVGIDILKMPKLKDVEYIQCDLKNFDVNKLKTRIDVVLSDIAPNITGVTTIDQENFMVVAESILEFCKVYLNYGGKMAMKFFNGYKLSELKDSLTDVFDEVSIYKPDSSRQKSREVYLVCVDYRHQ